MPISRTLDQNFFKTWTHNMAYTLGFFAADGSMLANKRGAHFIEFTITDRTVLEYIQKITHSSHRISERERGGNCKTGYRLQVGSKEWFSDLTRLGFTQQKSNTLQFPKIPRAFFGDFVRGYFDGDGCVYFSRCWSKSHQKKRWVFTTLFTSGSRRFLEELHLQLHSHGLIGGHISTKKRGWALVFSRYDSLALYRLMYHTADADDLCLPRKWEKLERAIKVLQLSSRDIRGRSSTG